MPHWTLTEWVNSSKYSTRAARRVAINGERLIAERGRGKIKSNSRTERKNSKGPGSGIKEEGRRREKGKRFDDQD